MKKYILLALFMLPMVAMTAIASEPEASDEDGTLCGNLARFSENLAVGQSRWLKLSTGFDKNALFSKSCRLSVKDARGAYACQWISEHSSSEFMDKNIARVLACLTRSPDEPPVHVLTSEMSGKITVFDPFVEDLKIRVDFEYSFKKTPEPEGNYYLFKVTGTQH